MAVRKAKESAAAEDPAVSELASAYSTLTSKYPSTIGMFGTLVFQPQPEPATIAAFSSEPMPLTADADGH